MLFKNRSCPRETTKNISHIFCFNATQLVLNLMELPAEEETKNCQITWHVFRKDQCKFKGAHASLLRYALLMGRKKVEQSGCRPLSLPAGLELVAKLEDMHVHAKGGVTVDAGGGEVLEPVPSIKPRR